MQRLRHLCANTSHRDANLPPFAVHPHARGEHSNTLDASFCVEALHEALERYGPPERIPP